MNTHHAASDLNQPQGEGLIGRPKTTERVDPHQYSLNILATAKDVTIDFERMEAVAKLLAEQPIELPAWNFSPIYPTDGTTEELARYFLLLNAVNYCFFHRADSEFHGERFTDGRLSGADLWAARLTANPSFYKQPMLLSLAASSELSGLFEGTVPMPLVRERIDHLKETALFIDELVFSKSSLVEWMRQSRGDAFEIAQTLASTVEGFRDPFLKRAQLFVGMLYGRIRGHDDCPIHHESISKLTVFADYRVPQALIGMGIVRVSPDLEAALTAKTEFTDGEAREQELRAASIYSGTSLAAALATLRGQPINALHVDYLLWKAPRDHQKGKSIPGLFSRGVPEFHRCVTTKY
jgi:hypothetical protein